MDRRLIETEKFPVQKVNLHSFREKEGRGRPSYWEMIFWWTRKPLIGARAIIAGSLLPEDVSDSVLNRLLRFDSGKSPHRFNPYIPDEIREKFQKVRLLDPFAGFGSIPLEAMRLGIGEVIAVELLPTAYVFLKAILEYPKRYGEKLKEDVEKWGRWIVEKLKEDEDLRELYDDDVAVYIGTWEVRCPVCGRYTPLVGNWWLARVKGKKYAHMRPRIEGNKVAVEVVEGKNAPSPNVRGRPESAECLLCGSRITYIEPRTGRVYDSRKGITKDSRNKLEFYPKFAVREWNEKVEGYLDGKISIEELRNALARPRLLIKVKIVDEDLEFEPATEEDNEKLWRALEKLGQLWEDPDIPKESIPSYESRRMVYPYGFDKWFKLFNPRQLLTLVKLVKLIREVGKKVEKDKLKMKLSDEEAFEYAEAVATYLAIALARFVDHTNLMTMLHASNPMGIEIAHALSVRGIAMQWNWGDTNPTITVRGLLRTNSFDKCLEKVTAGLSYLVSVISNSLSKVRIYLDDATVFSSLNNEKFDLVVTDPPYRDDVPYVELSDFYYVWLKRALSDDNLTPRFHQNILIHNTQWESFAVNEISYNKERLKYFGVKEAEDYYEKLLGMAFRRITELLKEESLLVTYFAHSSPEAWIELIEAGWKKANLKITKAWNIITESKRGVTRRGKTSLESSIVVVWRKRSGSETRSYNEVYEEAVIRADGSRKQALKSGLQGSDLFLATMIGALSTFTSYDRVLKFGRELSPRDIVRDSYAIATRIIADATKNIESPEALFYLAAKSIYRSYSRPEKVTPSGGLITDIQTEDSRSEPILLSSQDAIILSYGFLPEELTKTGENARRKRGKKGGVNLFVKAGLIERVNSSKGSKVAKSKEFVLLEPLSPTLNEIKSVLGKRGIDPIKLEASGRSLNSVDVLHLLEYYAKQGRGEFEIILRELYARCPENVREAIEMARVISRYPGDPEAELSRLCVKYVEG